MELDKAAQEVEQTLEKSTRNSSRKLRINEEQIEEAENNEDHENNIGGEEQDTVDNENSQVNSYKGQTTIEGIDISKKMDGEEAEFDIAVHDLDDIIATNIGAKLERNSSTYFQVNLNGSNSGRKPSKTTEVGTVEVEDDYSEQKLESEVEEDEVVVIEKKTKKKRTSEYIEQVTNEELLEK